MMSGENAIWAQAPKLSTPKAPMANIITPRSGSRLPDRVASTSLMAPRAGMATM